MSEKASLATGFFLLSKLFIIDIIAYGKIKEKYYTRGSIIERLA